MEEGRFVDDDGHLRLRTENHGDLYLDHELPAGPRRDVWRGRTPRTLREVAIKITRDAGPMHRDEWILTEASIQASLGAAARDHVVGVLYADWIARERPWTKPYRPEVMVTEFLPAGTLRDLLQAGKPSWQDAMTVARSTASALAEVHRLEWLHLDVKPSNIGLVRGTSPEGLESLLTGVRLLDFGSSVDGSLTPAYCSPEQAAGLTEELTGASDVYSLGCVLYELITGRSPFPYTTSPEHIRAHRFEAPVRPATRDPADGAWDELSRLVGHMLNKHPADRPTITEVRTSLAHTAPATSAERTAVWDRDLTTERRDAIRGWLDGPDE